MTPEEITKLTEEYAEEVTKDMAKTLDEPSCLLNETKRATKEYITDFMQWLLRTHCIVEKSKVKESEEVTIDGWVARDANGDLELYDGRYILERKNNLGYWTNGFDSVSLPDISFPSVTWESDPLEVTITIKPKKKQ